MIAAVLLASQVQSGSLLKELIPQPTGANGYEEFLRAADLLASDPKAKAAYDELGKVPPDGDVLAARRAAVEKAGAVLALVRAGALKPVVYPERDPLKPSSRDGIGLRRLGRIGLMAAYLSLADGKSAAATDDILAVLTMMDTLARNGREVGAYLAIADHEILFSMLDRVFDAFGPADLARIEKVANELVERPVYADVVRREFTGNLAILADVEENYRPKPSDIEPRNTQEKRFRTMTPEQRSVEIRLAVDLLRGLAARKIAVANGPERDWLPFNADAQPDIKGDASVPRWIVDSMDTGDQPAVALAVNRTKWRIVRLTARLRRIMAEEDRMSKSLPENLPRGYVDDVLGGGTFVFKSTSTGFTIESAGVPTTGPVTLVSRLPEQPEEGEKP